MAKVTQPGKGKLGFGPRSSDPRAGAPASHCPPQWQGAVGRVMGALDGRPHKCVLLSAAHASGCPALAQGAKKGRCPRSFCSSSGCPAERPRESNALELGRAGSESQLHPVWLDNCKTTWALGSSSVQWSR